MSEEQKEQEREIIPLTNEHGETKQYETVASRLVRFRKDHPELALKAEMIKDDGDAIAFKATIGRYTESGVLLCLAEGHAQEYHNSSSINRSARMEVAETSAWGRALAAFGYGSPTGIATLEEVEKAQRREKVLQSVEPGVLVLLQNAAKKGIKELVAVWEGLSREERDSCSKYMTKLKREAQEVTKNGKAKTEAGRASEEGVRNPPPKHDDLD